MHASDQLINAWTDLAAVRHARPAALNPPQVHNIHCHVSLLVTGTYVRGQSNQVLGRKNGDGTRDSGAV
uniref:Uncharacterized protein n=1 Tax=Arundo donax TaxID=35708 RepID=A0A0A9H189_ARUDO